MVVDTKTGSFTTLGALVPSGLDENLIDSARSGGSQKILHNGQLYIIRDGKAYDLTGKAL